MTRFALAPLLFLSLVLLACTEPVASELELAEADTAGLDADGKSDADPSWDVAPTLHVGGAVFDAAAAGGRRVHPLWLAGTPGAPVRITVSAAASAGSSVRVAVLGPLQHGARAVLGAGGYGAPAADVAVTIASASTGEHLVVVGSHGLATETWYDLVARCAANATCDARAIDVLASPKAGALVGDADRLVRAELGAALAGRTDDVELELWAAPPMQPWYATHVATSVASGTQVNVIVPPDVEAGDDLWLVVRAGDRVLDAGVVTRFAPEPRAFARVDRILYGDLASMQIAGVVGFFEGSAELVLRSHTRDVEIASHAVTAALPGATGNGFGAFDATFAPELADAHGNLNPNLPRNGDLLSVGWRDGNGGYRALACFEYCNDLSGFATCTGDARPCP